jgi:hypothetical protein
MVASMKVAVFWDVAACCLVEVDVLEVLTAWHNQGNE